MFIITFFIFATSFGSTTKKLYEAVPTDCIVFPRNWIYEDNKCIRTGDGLKKVTYDGVSQKFNLSCFTNYTYTTPDCTGTPKTSSNCHSYFNLDYNVRNIAFVSDKNKGCELGDKNGMYYNDECHIENQISYQYMIFNNSGVLKLGKCLMPAPDCGGYCFKTEELLTSNTCVNGVLVHCFDDKTKINRNKAYATGETPSSNYNVDDHIDYNKKSID
ncbi:hypothetical protein EIN_511930 [Entamoeba invadens IP1]|uniref:Uncharacterized protein n=1 Tax=Entamoeba invadens IP1 TaxID=370355 RepID=A0A0A1U974_ENTIV|nr:hypothetical protein EIN_511930 [Entamoeba invadens IP1]ELP91500.1 hypothetical protein EIN_511930 [Entamoeba invadens IP1]|eukprot:XP_004258271.1 hypothetical protein EIN_511930 [Entamoeba invadens IP1]